MKVSMETESFLTVTGAQGRDACAALRKLFERQFLHPWMSRSEDLWLRNRPTTNTRSSSQMAKHC